MNKISINGREYRTISSEDPYAKHLQENHSLETVRLRNFLTTIFKPHGQYIFADVGANIGFISCTIADMFTESSMHCFEPATKVFSCLSENVSQFPNITANHCAVGREKTQILFHENSAYGHIVKNATTLAGSSLPSVKCVSLSDYASSHKIAKFNFVKVDCEGFELDVFLGLKKRADFIFFEFNPFCISHHYRANPFEVLEQISESYILYRFHSDTLIAREDNITNLFHDVIVNKSYDDFIAVPREENIKLPAQIVLVKHQSRYEVLDLLYQAILGRSADNEGLHHFIRQYRKLDDDNFVLAVTKVLLFSIERQVVKNEVQFAGV
jgi:FkbM family methyltransferase